MPVVIVKVFAVLREKLGLAQIELDCDTVDDMLEIIRNLYPMIIKDLETCNIAINTKYVTTNVNLNQGDEIALLPPISGG